MNYLFLSNAKATSHVDYITQSPGIATLVFLEGFSIAR